MSYALDLALSLWRAVEGYASEKFPAEWSSLATSTAEDGSVRASDVLIDLDAGMIGYLAHLPRGNPVTGLQSKGSGHAVWRVRRVPRQLLHAAFATSIRVARDDEWNPKHVDIEGELARLDAEVPDYNRDDYRRWLHYIAATSRELEQFDCLFARNVDCVRRGRPIGDMRVCKASEPENGR